MPEKQSILVFCSHSDDQILGPGASLAKYAREGESIYTVILSYGEAGLAWLKPEIAIKIRVNEAKKADKIIGGGGVYFVGLKEGRFLEEAKEESVEKSIERIIKEKMPTKIFTHSAYDPHPDHKAANKIILDILDKIKYRCDVYSFDIWNPFVLRKTNFPKLYVDVTETFPIKIKAIKVFQSQKIALFTLFWSVYIRAILHGFHINKRYGERFFKIR